MNRRNFAPLDAVRIVVTPDPADVQALERKRAELRYQPRNPFHRDIQQPRVEETTPALCRRQA